MIMISVSAISLTDKMLELLRKPEMKPDNILTEEKITKVWKFLMNIEKL